MGLWQRKLSDMARGIRPLAYDLDSFVSSYRANSSALLWYASGSRLIKCRGLASPVSKTIYKRTSSILLCLVNSFPFLQASTRIESKSAIASASNGQRNLKLVLCCQQDETRSFPVMFVEEKEPNGSSAQAKAEPTEDGIEGSKGELSLSLPMTLSLARQGGRGVGG